MIMGFSSLLKFEFAWQQVEFSLGRREKERYIEKSAFRRVPDASYASNIAMQAWNI